MPEDNVDDARERDEIQEFIPFDSKLFKRFQESLGENVSQSEAQRELTRGIIGAFNGDSEQFQRYAHDIAEQVEIDYN